MRAWTHLRLVALAFTAVCARLAFFSDANPGRNTYVYIVFINAFLYSHFLLAFWASRRKVWVQLKSSSTGLLIGLLLVSCALIGFLPPEISFIWFGVHFAFSEAYSPMVVGYAGSTSSEMRPFRTAHIFYILLIYFLATAHTLNDVLLLSVNAWNWIRWAIYAGLVLAVINYGYQYRRALKKNHDPDFAIAFAVPETMFLIFAMIAHFYRVHWTITALYHISFWFVFQWMGREKRPAYAVDILSTAGIMAVAAYFFPQATSVPGMATEHLALSDETLSAIHLNMNVGTFHILFSFALSNLNPGWVRASQSRL